MKYKYEEIEFSDKKNKDNGSKYSYIENLLHYC